MVKPRWIPWDVSVPRSQRWLCQLGDQSCLVPVVVGRRLLKFEIYQKNWPQTSPKLKKMIRDWRRNDLNEVAGWNLLCFCC